METAKGSRKYTLSQARMLAGITQADMAKRLGVSEATYVKYEKYRGYMRVDKAARFEQIVNLQGDDKVIFFK